MGGGVANKKGPNVFSNLIINWKFKRKAEEKDSLCKMTENYHRFLVRNHMHWNITNVLKEKTPKFYAIDNIFESKGKWSLFIHIHTHLEKVCHQWTWTWKNVKGNFSGRKFITYFFLLIIPLYKSWHSSFNLRYFTMKFTFSKINIAIFTHITLFLPKLAPFIFFYLWHL